MGLSARLIGGVIAVAVMVGCQSTPPPVQVQNNSYPPIIVQKTLRAGMSQVEISQILGPPKVIQNGARGGEKGIEVWLFDVPAEETIQHGGDNNTSLTLKINANPAARRNTNGTVEVKFDASGKAESFMYQAKNF